MSSHATAAIASSSDASPPVVASTPGRARLARGRWRRGRVLSLLALLAALAVLAPLLLRGPSSTTERHVTEDIGTGPVSQVVGATGALNPVTTVLVGAQVSGTVASRHVDYNSRVKPGDVLLRLEPTLLQAEVDQAAAELADKQALLGVAQANLLRYEGSVARGLVAPLSLDQYRQAVASATAQVTLAQAKLARARANLGYMTVRLPVAGVVVAREVEVGQTVAANFQTPTPFQDRTGSDAEADRHQRGRAGRRLDPARRAGVLHRRCLPRPSLYRHGAARATEPDDPTERRHLQRRR